MPLPIGSIINALAIILGGALGLLLRQSFSEKMKRAVFQALGLSVLLIGMQMALLAQDVLAVVMSVVIGTVVGTFLDLESRLEKLGDTLKQRFSAGNEQLH